MNIWFKNIFIVILSTIVVACSKKDEFLVSDKCVDETINVSIEGIINGYVYFDETKAEAQTIVRIMWKGGEKVYVYDGQQYIGYLTASIAGSDGSYAKLSGTLDAPSGTKPVTLVYSPQFSGIPILDDGKIVLDLSLQNQSEVPFMIYGTLPSTTGSSISDAVVKFSLATSIYKCNCAGLDNDQAISMAVMGRMNTKCELNLSNSVVPSVSASSPGRITRTTGITASDTRAIFSVALAQADAAEYRRIEITKGEITFVASFSKSAFAVSKAYNAVFDFIPKPTTGKALATISGEQKEVGWVQLWKDGPKFAEYNVGVTDGKITSYGVYYGWGAVQGGIDVYRNDYNNGTTSLSGETDTATKLWGDNWRMLSYNEIEELLNSSKCTSTWQSSYNGVPGLLYCGLEGSIYANNKVFFPASGYYWYSPEGGKISDKNVEGYYWTSYCGNRTANAYFLRFKADSREILWYSRSYGRSVRAVLVEKEVW